MKIKENLEKVTKRSIFIIDKHFQYKYSIILTFIAFCVGSLFAFHILYFFNETIRIFIPNYESIPEIAGLISLKKKEIIIYILVLLSLSSIFVFFFGIILTHKMAGPIMVIKKKIEEFTHGAPNTRITLRKGDEFKDLANSLNLMFKKIGKKNE